MVTKRDWQGTRRRPQRRLKPSLRGDEERNELVLKNMALVGYVIHKLMRRSVAAVGRDIDNAIQDGCLGLIRAAELFDESKAKIAQIGIPWIRQCILRGREMEGGAVSIPHDRRHMPKDSVLDSPMTEVTPEDARIDNDPAEEASDREIAQWRKQFIEKLSSWDALNDKQKVLLRGLSQGKSISECSTLIGVTRQRSSTLLKEAVEKIRASKFAREYERVMG